LNWAALPANLHFPAIDGSQAQVHFCCGTFKERKKKKSNQKSSTE
jgi:hypothetical protein